MPNPMIQKIWMESYDDFCSIGSFQSDVQRKASQAILQCKTGSLGYNVSECPDCGHTEFHSNSCRNRNCPNCQAVSKEIWVDKRRAEVIDSPYFHVVFTLPHELNPLIYCNQTLLYGLLHKCCSQTLLELCADQKYLGATPGIIQVLHTWNQELDYHIHMHCIISGGGITKDSKLRCSKEKFFIPVFVLRDKFKGKYLALLKKLYQKESLYFSGSCLHLKNADTWASFCDSLYRNKECIYVINELESGEKEIECITHYDNKIHRNTNIRDQYLLGQYHGIPEETNIDFNILLNKLS